MVKGKFQEYLPTDKCSWTYSCLYCRAHLARHEDLISKSFQGSRGRAYLFHQVVNAACSEAKQRLLLTGVHFVADVFCACCQTMIGWKYERAFEPSQRYKEGKVILELVHLIKDNCWDSQWMQPQRSPSSNLSCSSPTHSGSPTTAPPFPFDCMHTVYPTIPKPPITPSSSSRHRFFRSRRIENQLSYSPPPLQLPESSHDRNSRAGSSSDSTQPVTPEHDDDLPCTTAATAYVRGVDECPSPGNHSLLSTKRFTNFHNTFPRYQTLNLTRLGLLETPQQFQETAFSCLSSPPSKPHRLGRPSLLRRRTSSSSPSRDHLLPLVSDDENDPASNNPLSPN